MPTVSSLLSGSVSIGIIAGVVSGLWYLVVAGIRWAGRLRSSLQAEGEDVRCARCETLAAGRRCSDCEHRRELKLQSGDWFYRHIQSRYSGTPSIPENSTAKDNGTAMEPESAQIREFIERLVESLVSGQLDDVKLNRLYTHPEYDRMFASHHSALCENLVQLSFALQMAIMNKPLPVADTPSAVHAALKHRVEHIIQEAMTLPHLKTQVPEQNGSAIHKWEDDITSMTYEDILATAILNKVIEQFQQRTGVVVSDTVDGNHNSPSESSMEHAQTSYISQVEIGVNNHDDCDTSLQEGLRSWSDLSHTEPLSLTVEQCIEEEVTTYDSAGEEDEDRSSDGVATTSSELDFYLSGLNFIKNRRVPFPELGVDIVDGRKVEHNSEEDELSDSSQPTDLISPVDSWEANWLFQRRRLKLGGTADSVRRSPIPVPMLVPNPSEEYRARIGDRDVEEVSDLSDCSDGALEDIVLAGLETNLTSDHLPEVSVTSEPHEVILDSPEAESIAAMATNQSIETEVTSASVNLAKAPSVECLSELGQQDSEYTEDYASVTQRQISSLPEQIAPTKLPVPKPRMLPVSSQPIISPHQELSEDAKQDTELSAPPRPGTIAEREHRKWESAPPLPNNPYSPENINKRLSRQSAGFSSRTSSVSSIDFPEMMADRAPSPLQVICTSGDLDHKRYGRDYYINNSKAASGERRSSSTSTSPLLQQVCDTSNLLDLEQQALHRNIYRNSFRACNSASMNFTVNPLFEHRKSKTVQTEDINHKAEIVETVSIVDGVSVRDGVHINPLFDCQTLEIEKEDHTSEDSALRDGDQCVGPMKFGQESGYSSLSDSLAVPQANSLRLLPPSKPQMIERSFESLASLRRSSSLRDSRRRPGERSEMGGSLRTRCKHKAQDHEQLAL